jgi:hypothetical protein
MRMGIKGDISGHFAYITVNEIKTKGPIFTHSQVWPNFEQKYTETLDVSSQYCSESIESLQSYRILELSIELYRNKQHWTDTFIYKKRLVSRINPNLLLKIKMQNTWT